MSYTESTMVDLGTKAPHFKLFDVISQKPLGLDDIKGEKGTLIMFICNHCPYVKHVIDELVQIGKDYMPRGIGAVAISSNDVINYPDDSPDKMKIWAAEKDFPFPYLYDETQEVAKAYDAACTPDLYLFDENLKLVYRGQLDDSRPKNDVPVTGQDLREAIDQLLSGEEIPKEQKPSAGCNIKWKKD
jgi:peroxiredoxin